MSEDQIKDLEHRLDGILERLTRIETVLNERCDTRGQVVEGLSSRVRALEINQAKVIGAATLFSVALGYILKGLGLE